MNTDTVAPAGALPGKRGAVLYRMALPEHTCPFGIKALDLLRRHGYQVEDRLLRTRAEVDAFKAEHSVKTTPQVWIEGQRVGGHDDLRRHLGLGVIDPKAPTYAPVLAIFGMAAALAAAVSWGLRAGAMSPIVLALGLATALLALQKLRDVESFTTGFLGYDLLAQRVPRYAYVYPWAEALVGLLMIAGVWPWLWVPVALVIGGIGAVSVIKAVYIEGRDLRCACVGGHSNVPLGFVSLLENLVMVAMGLGMGVWMVLA